MKKRNVLMCFIAAVVFAVILLLRFNTVLADTVCYWNGTGGGEGTYDDPWVIVSAEDLVMLAADVDRGSSYKGYYFLLGDDISLEGTAWIPVGNMEHPFAGTFDGAGNEITQLNLTGGECCGLFGVLEGEVKDLSVSGSVSGTYNVGGIAGYNLGTISGCFFGGSTVSGDGCVGAIAGYTGYSARIENCSSDVMVNCSGSFVGGIAGFADGLRGYADVVSSLKNVSGRRVRRGEITDCRFSGSVSYTGSNGATAAFNPETGIISNEFVNSMFGGIAGASSGYTVKNCVSTGEISGVLLTGGIVGGCYNGGLVEGCRNGDQAVAFGGSTVDGVLLTGGIAGFAGNSTISGSTSFGSVNGENFTGGIIGFADEHTGLDGLVSEGSTEGKEYTGGIAGYIRGSFNAENLTSAGTVSGENYTGGITGYASDTLSHCKNSARVKGTSFTGGAAGYAKSGVFFGENAGQIEGGKYVGGIAGYSGKALSECKNSGSTAGTEYVGGIAGYSDGSIKNSENKGTVTGISSGAKHVGGIAGFAGQALSFDTNKGTVSSEGGCAGGIAGEGKGSVDNCVNEADVTGGADDAGGIAGKLHGDGISIMNCLNKGNVKCTSGGICGGIVGITNASVLYSRNGTDSDRDITVSGYDYVGGIVGQTGENEVYECENYGSVSSGGQICGGIAGQAGNCEMSGCENYGSVNSEGQICGGITGRCVGKGHFSNCKNSGQVSGSQYVGGIAGELNGSVVIHDCQGNGRITGKSYAGYLGGIAGVLKDDSKVQGCKCDSDNSVQCYTGSRIGGIAGSCLDRAVISDCSNAGIVGGYKDIGGIAGTVTDNGQIRRCLNSGSITAAQALAGISSYAGGIVSLVGDPDDSSNTPVVADCINEGTVKGDSYIGGIAAVFPEGGTVTNCTNKGSIEGSGDYIGGVIGRLQASYFECCTNNGSVTYTGKDEDSDIGGVIGVNETADVVNCLNTGRILGQASTKIGGIVGHNKGTVRTCTNNGEIASYGIFAGGIAGQNDHEVLTCVNRGKVKAGGIVAVNYGRVSSCINRGELYNIYDVGGRYSIFINYDPEEMATWKLEAEFDEKKGGIVSVLASGSVENCINYGLIGSKKYSGGIVAFMKRGTSVKKCTNKGEVSGRDIIGGIVGGVENRNSGTCIIEECLNDAKVCKNTYRTGDMTGGIAGQAYYATITKCVNKGEIDWETDSHRAGGIVGYAETCSVTDCINEGDVFSRARFIDDLNNPQFTSLGGIVGEAQNNCVIERCRNDALVFGDKVDDIKYSDRTVIVNGIPGYEGLVDYRGLDYMRGIGGIVGYCRGTTSIRQCRNDGYVFAKGVMVGGIVGAFMRKTAGDIIEDCYDTGKVLGHSSVGGIAGYIGEREFWKDGRRYLPDIPERGEKGEMYIAHNYCKTPEPNGRPDSALIMLLAIESHYSSNYYVWDYGVSSYTATGISLEEDSDYFIKITCGALIGNNNTGYNTINTLLRNYWWSRSSLTALGNNWDSFDHDGEDYSWYHDEERFADKSNFNSWNFSEIWEIRDSVPMLRIERTLEGYLAGENGWANIDLNQIGGTGSKEPDLSISTAIYSSNDLWGLQEAVNAGNSFEGATFYLYCDIDAYSNAKPIGKVVSVEEPGFNRPFKGTFDGRGHSINGLNILADSSLNSSSVGLFGYLSGDAVVRNLNVSGTVGEKSNYMFSGSYIGGIAGYCDGNSRIENCSFKGNVGASKNINDCYVGGIAGYCAHKDKQTNVWPNIEEQTSTVGNCFHVGKVFVNKGYAGGVAGSCEKMTNCYHAGGTVTSGNHEAGGVAGSSSHADRIFHCYAGEGSAVALVPTGSQQNSTSGCAFLSEEAMKNSGSFAGFDFDDVWTMGRDYAYLRLKSAFSRMKLKVNDGTGMETTVWYPKGAAVYSTEEYEGNDFAGWNAASDGYSGLGLDRYLDFSNLYGLSRAREGLTVYGRFIEGEQYGTTFNVSGYGQTEFYSEELFIPSGITLIGNSNYEAKEILVTLEAKDSQNGRWETIAAGINVILPKGNGTQANVSFETGSRQYCCFRLTLSPITSAGVSLSGVKLWQKDAQSRRNAVVALYTDGESDRVITQSLKIGQSLTLPYNSESRNGYIFTGWNTESDGSGSFYKAGESYTVTGDTRLFAEWIPEDLPAARNLVYNGTEQELIYPGVAAVPVIGSAVSAGQSGVVTGAGIYFYAAVKNGSPEPATGAFGPQIPLGKEAGTYKVYYRVQGSDTSLGYVLVNLKKKTVTVKAQYSTKTAGSADPVFETEVNGLVAGEPQTVINYTISRDVGETPGTYALTPEGDVEQGNYKVIYQTGQLVIKPKPNEESHVPNDDENGKADDPYHKITEDVSTDDTTNDDTSAGNTTTAVIDHRDGSVTEITETRNTDGTTRKTEITTKTDGSTESVTVTVDVKGNVLQTVQESVTQSRGGTVRVTTSTENADGSKIDVEEKTTAKGKVTTKVTATDAEGNTTQSTETKKTDGSYTFSSKTVNTDGSTETVKKSKHSDGSIESETVKVTVRPDADTGKKKTDVTIKKVSRDADGDKESFTYTGTREAKGKSLKKAGRVSLKKVRTESDTVIIPELITAGNKSYKVETIAAKTFADNKLIETVKIASTVKIIGKNAFAGAENLCAVEVTDSITKIGKGAFDGIAENAVITVKAADQKSFERVKALIKASGIGDGVTIVMAD